ncbi:hypothetical protein BHM03_00040395 [Ensete ventricosum]|nr:hypothetical protein BHM03_00040395 [Ensete ventricosum]
MSSKTLARVGASLIDRIFVSYPPKPINAFLLPRISSDPPVRCFAEKFLAARSPPPGTVGGGDAESLKILASSQGIGFPCGLPSLRFFIDEGEIIHFWRNISHRLILTVSDIVSPHVVLLLMGCFLLTPHIHFLCRKATKGGRKVIARRIAKGRQRIAV